MLKIDKYVARFQLICTSMSQVLPIIIDSMYVATVHMYIYLHLQYVGVELALRHIRDGVELEPIDVNHHYDFNFQQFNFIPRVKILPVSN